MERYKSRMERLRDKLCNTAVSGRWSLQVYLYPSEIKRARNQWKVVVTELTMEKVNEKVPCMISWSNAFEGGIRPDQSWYISHITDIMPKVETPAQRLFLLSARA